MADYIKQLKDSGGNNIYPALGLSTVTGDNVDWSDSSIPDTMTSPRLVAQAMAPGSGTLSGFTANHMYDGYNAKVEKIFDSTCASKGSGDDRLILQPGMYMIYMRAWWTVTGGDTNIYTGIKAVSTADDVLNGGWGLTVGRMCLDFTTTKKYTSAGTLPFALYVSRSASTLNALRIYVYKIPDYTA